MTVLKFLPVWRKRVLFLTVVCTILLPAMAQKQRQLRDASETRYPLKAYIESFPAGPLKRGRRTRPGRVVISPEVVRAIKLASIRYEIDEALIGDVVRAESGFDPKAISDKGAMGLMQLMPQTAAMLGVINPFDPVENVDAGVRYFRALLRTNHGNVQLALAAYNAGERAVWIYGGIPPYRETQGYVQSITSLYIAQKLQGVRTLPVSEQGSHASMSYTLGYHH